MRVRAKDLRCGDTLTSGYTGAKVMSNPIPSGLGKEFVSFSIQGGDYAAICKVHRDSEYHVSPRT